MFSKFTIIFAATILFLFGIVLQPVAAITTGAAADMLDKLDFVQHKNTTAIPSSIIPPTCGAQCSDSVLGVFTNCTQSGCACTDDNSGLITACMNCLTTANTISQSVATAVQGDYVRICDGMNMFVKSSVSGASMVTPARVVATVMAATILSLLA
ncbi:hypothetical protein C8J56DRAFT_1041622 [Mycena floridula]|nr:hypothetical protein C8J56DRAFT_1041622 [Mycena floridula]